MAGDTIITVVGNLTADPELRFTPSGAAVANFTVASTPRNFDRQSGEWKDGEALFLRCNIWRQAAENVAETLTRGIAGDRVRPAQAAFVRDPRGREAHRRRARGRRDRPVAAGTPPPRSTGSAAAPTAARRRRRRLRRRLRRLAAAAAAAPRRRPTTRGARAPPAGRSGPATNRRSEPHLLELNHSPGAHEQWPKPVLRKPKKKVCAFCKDKAQDIDYKDTALLRKFISDRGKIRARRVTGNCSAAPARHRDRGQERPRGRPAALHLDRALRKDGP